MCGAALSGVLEANRTPPPRTLSHPLPPSPTLSLSLSLPLAQPHPHRHLHHRRHSHRHADCRQLFDWSLSPAALLYGAGMASMEVNSPQPRTPLHPLTPRLNPTPTPSRPTRRNRRQKWQQRRRHRLLPRPRRCPTPRPLQRRRRRRPALLARKPTSSWGGLSAPGRRAQPCRAGHEAAFHTDQNGENAHTPFFLNVRPSRKAFIDDVPSCHEIDLMRMITCVRFDVGCACGLWRMAWVNDQLRIMRLGSLEGTSGTCSAATVEGGDF